jgi:hypothetical protein
MSPDSDQTTPMTIPPFDRRLYARSRAARPAKLFHRAGLAYAPGTSEDLSEGGALLKLHSARRFEAGDVVDIVVEPKVAPGVVRTRSLIEATVIRSMPLGDAQQFVAVRFARTRSEFGPERVAA